MTMKSTEIIKAGIFAGLCFGSGYWYAKFTAQKTPPRPPTSKAIDLDELEKRQARYEAIQKRLKLTYYDELSSLPRKNALADLPEAKAPKLEEQKPSSDRLAKSLEKVLGGGTPESVSNAAQVDLPSKTGSLFAIQVASLPDRKVAEELVNRLALKGYPVRLVQAEVPERGRVYRVRIHGYQSQEEADAARSLFEKTEQLDAITVAQ